MSTCTTSLKVSLVSSCSSAQPVLFTWAEYYSVCYLLRTLRTWLLYSASPTHWSRPPPSGQGPPTTQKPRYGKYYLTC